MRRDARAELALCRVEEDGVVFETGRPARFHFVRCTEKSPYFGARFGQDIEPAGRYMLHNERPGDLPRNWVEGDIEFQSPIVMALTTDEGAGIYDLRHGWKGRLSRAFGGATGVALSRAIMESGHDAVVTCGAYGGELRDTREIVDLRVADNRAARSFPVRDVIRLVARRAHERCGASAPWLGEIAVRQCGEADRDHDASERQFMHAGHRRLTICYAQAAEALALPWKVGLAVHEVGHFAAGGPDIARRHTEGEANEMGSAATGIRVIFKGPQMIEWARPPVWLRRALDASRR